MFGMNFEVDMHLSKVSHVYSQKTQNFDMNLLVLCFLSFEHSMEYLAQKPMYVSFIFYFPLSIFVKGNIYEKMYLHICLSLRNRFKEGVHHLLWESSIFDVGKGRTFYATLCENPAPLIWEKGRIDYATLCERVQPLWRDNCCATLC